MTLPLLELRDVSKRFEPALDWSTRLARSFGSKVPRAVVHAVDQVNLSIQQGEVLGLVGESGCGKSTVARIAAGLLQMSAGRRLWRGIDMARTTVAASVTTSGTTSATASAQESAHPVRDQHLALQMIFQDPYASLNPRLRVKELIGEAPRVHGLIHPYEQDDYVAAQLQRVGLDASLAQRYPHQFSGGQRARIGIARALAVRPELLICDEAVAALDVSIQAQVLNLFMQLREELQLTYLFISHDLGVVRHIADRVVVMYLGRIIEEAAADDLFSQSNHPYTQALLSEAPSLTVKKKTFVAIKGEIPSPLQPPAGCHFHPRCPYVMPRCKVEVPALKAIAPGHFSACHLNDANDTNDPH